MALSGVDRLLAYARDLGVEPARTSHRPAATESPQPVREAEGDGIRLTLSSASEASPPTTAAIPETNVTTPVERFTPTPTGAAESAGAATGKALGAYQRRDPAELGQRIAIRA